MASIPNDDLTAPDQPTMWVEGDVLVVRLYGTWMAPDMQRVFAMTEALYAQNGYILLLADAKHSTGLHPDARKLQAEGLKRHIRPSHTAIYHVNTVIRMMSVLAQRGIELITGKTYPVTFHKDEAEARAEIARQRAVLQRSAPPPG
jgi:hypothetical protein